MIRIDLNADVGETSSNEDLMQYVTSVNIACGGHAGDEALMRLTVEHARRHEVAIGAHPGYPDRANFGRVRLDMPLDAVAAFVFGQITALSHITADIVHVKPHGALYNAAAQEEPLAEAIAAGVARWSRNVVLVGLAGSRMLDVFAAAGFRTAAEAFADRRYEPDGSLRNRKYPDALTGDPAQAVTIATKGEVVTVDSSVIPCRADTICVHSDSPGAVRMAAAIRAALEQAGVAVTR